MSTEEVPQGTLDEKLGDLKIEEPETVTESPEEQKEAVLEELTDSPPGLHHVETVDTTTPDSETPTTDDGVVKSEVPEAFAEELKSDHDIVPPEGEKPTETVEPVAPETETAPATTEEASSEKKPSKIGSIGDKITGTLHKLIGKE